MHTNKKKYFCMNICPATWTEINLLLIFAVNNSYFKISYVIFLVLLPLKFFLCLNLFEHVYTLLQQTIATAILFYNLLQYYSTNYSTPREMIKILWRCFLWLLCRLAVIIKNKNKPIATASKHNWKSSSNNKELREVKQTSSSMWLSYKHFIDE